MKVMEPFLYSSLVGMTFLSCLKKLKQTVYLEIPASFLVLPLHGSMPTINQCEIFDRPRANVRYFRCRSLLPVDFMPVKNATNFCFCTTKNAEENF
ncbi:unnamed protein product [Camellia sinensis]